MWMAPRNRSVPVELTISLPAQTHAYLVKLATAGALGQTEALIAARIVVNKIEKLIKDRRAETVAAQAAPSDATDVGDEAP
jgi:hypothetical protein